LPEQNKSKYIIASLSVIASIVTILSLFFGFYTYFHERKPNLLFEIISESNVLDLHKPLENLTIYLNNENINKKNLNLRILTLQVSNNGELDILQPQYDQNVKWGININNGKIINSVRILNSNSEYLKANISPTIVNDNFIEFRNKLYSS
jgi:hypothetical protein